MNQIKLYVAYYLEDNKILTCEDVLRIFKFYHWSGSFVVSMEAVEQNVQRTASGEGWRIRLANKIIGLGWWLAGNGSR